MGMARVCGMLAIAPTAVLLTLSFFVLVVVRKIEKDGLKVFGYVAAVLLWIAAAIVFATGIYILSATHCMKREIMHQMMRQQMQPPMMEQKSMPHPGMKR